MATGKMWYPAGVWSPADGSANNAAALYDIKQGDSGTNPKIRFPRWHFIHTVDTYIHMPGIAVDYAGDPVLELYWYSGNPDGGAEEVVWKTYIAASSAGDDVESNTVATQTDTAVAPSGTAFQLVISTLVITNPDGLADNDLMNLILGRKVADALDDHDYTVYVIGGLFTWTTT